MVVWSVTWVICLKSKLAREVSRPSSLVKSKDSEVETMPWLVGDASRLREELSKFYKKYRFTVEIKIVLALGSGIFSLKTTTGSVVGSLKEVKAGVVETDGDLEKAQKDITVLGSPKKRLVEKILFLSEDNCLYVRSVPTSLLLWMRRQLLYSGWRRMLENFRLLCPRMCMRLTKVS